MTPKPTRRQTVFIFVMCVFALPVASRSIAQEADVDEKSSEIIADCIEAMGSEMAIAGVPSFQATGQLSEGPGGSAMTFKIKSIDGKIWASADEGKFISVSNGEHEWRVSLNGSPDLIPDDEGRTFGDGFPFPSLVVHWLDYCKKVRYVGETNFGDSAVFELEFETSKGNLIQRYFDKTTALLIGQKMHMRFSELAFSYEYGELEGVQFLNKLKIVQEGNNQTMTFEYDVDAEIDEAIFEIPDEVKQQIKDGVPTRRRLGDKSKDKR